MNLKRLLIIVIIVILAAVAAVWYFYSAADSPKTEFVTATSTRYGYTISHPADWIFDESQELAPADLITSPTGDAILFIQIYQDERTATADGRITMLAEIEKRFRTAEGYALNILQSAATSTHPGYVAAGRYTENGIERSYKEIGTFTTSAAVVSLRGVVQVKVAKILGPTLDQIMASFGAKTTATLEVE